MGTSSTGKGISSNAQACCISAFETNGRPLSAHTPFLGKSCRPILFHGAARRKIIRGAQKAALPAAFSHNPRQATRPVLGGKRTAGTGMRREPAKEPKRMRAILLCFAVPAQTGSKKRGIFHGMLSPAAIPAGFPESLSLTRKAARPPPFETEASRPPSGAPKTIKQTCAGTRNMCCSVLCFQYPKAPISGSLGRQIQQCLTNPKLLNII